VEQINLDEIAKIFEIKLEQKTTASNQSVDDENEPSK
jgi:hypothetical protein